MSNSLTVHEEIIYVPWGSAYRDSTITYGLQSGVFPPTRTADVSGSFTPGVYKVTPFYAITRAMLPYGSDSLKWSTRSGDYIYNYTLDGCIGMIGNHQSYLSQAFEYASSTISDSLRKEALLKAFGNVGDLAQLELTTELGELRETLDLLGSTILLATRPKDLWTNLTFALHEEKFLRKVTPKALSGLSSKYLEVRYGWLPLMRSISDIYEKLVEGLRRLENLTAINSSRGKTKLLNKRKVFSQDYVYGSLKFRVIYEIDHDIMARAVVHYKIVEPPTLADLLGLSPKFIPESAWALTKLSFIWDWFLSLGPWLSALRTSIDTSFTLLGNASSVTIESRGLCKVSILNAGAPKNNFVVPISGKEVRRVINQPVPLPQFRYGVVLDIYKYLDLFLISLQFIPKDLRKQLVRAFSHGSTVSKK